MLIVASSSAHESSVEQKQLTATTAAYQQHNSKGKNMHTVLHMVFFPFVHSDVMKQLNIPTPTGQPPPQPLELLQALGKMMGEIRNQVRFREVVLRGNYIEQFPRVCILTSLLLGMKRDIHAQSLAVGK